MHHDGGCTCSHRIIDERAQGATSMGAWAGKRENGNGACISRGGHWDTTYVLRKHDETKREEAVPGQIDQRMGFMKNGLDIYDSHSVTCHFFVISFVISFFFFLSSFFFFFFLLLLTFHLHFLVSSFISPFVLPSFRFSSSLLLFPLFKGMNYHFHGRKRTGKANKSSHWFTGPLVHWSIGSLVYIFVHVRGRPGKQD